MVGITGLTESRELPAGKCFIKKDAARREVVPQRFPAGAIKVVDSDDGVERFARKRPVGPLQIKLAKLNRVRKKRGRDIHVHGRDLPPHQRHEPRIATVSGGKFQHSGADRNQARKAHQPGARRILYPRNIARHRQRTATH